jgi:hypothetical protein
MTQSRKSGWNLYWVAYDGDEDCFVVARNSRSAKSYDANFCGYDAKDSTATHVCHISRTTLSRAKSRATKQGRQLKWPDHADDWLLKSVGAKTRFLEDQKETLIDGTVFTHNFEYSVPPRDIGRKYYRRLRNDPIFLEREEDIYSDSQMSLLQLLGICLARCQEIEYLIAHSFVLGLNEADKRRYVTIGNMRKAWEKKTFGQMLSTIKEAWTLDPEFERHLELFKSMRNRLVHGLTTSDRYNISDEWGQDECFSFLVFFEIVSQPVRAAFRASLYASIDFAIHHFKDEIELSTKRLTRKQRDEIQLFADLFRPLGEVR